MSSRKIERREALAAADAAAAVILGHWSRGVTPEEKAGGEPVSIADREADDAARQHLARAFPGEAILSEESVDDASRLSRDRVWIVDPLDGSRDFLAGVPEFAVHVALVEAGRPVVGVVRDVVGGRAWAAVSGEGTEERDATGAWRRLPRESRQSEDRLRLAVSRLRRSQSLERFRAHLPPHEIHPSGSLGLKAAALARGECDLYVVVSRKLGEWDGAAPELVVSESGGKVSDLAGRPLRYNQPDPRLKCGLMMGREPALGTAMDAVRALAGEIDWLPPALGGCSGED